MYEYECLFKVLIRQENVNSDFENIDFSNRHEHNMHGKYLCCAT